MFVCGCVCWCDMLCDAVWCVCLWVACVCVFVCAMMCLCVFKCEMWYGMLLFVLRCFVVTVVCVRRL